MRRCWHTLLIISFGYLFAIPVDSIADLHQLPTITIRVTPHPVNTFVPSRALGAGIDAHDKGIVDRIYRRETIKAMLSAGFKPLTYRLRTELGIEAWHWNPKGVWSDPANQQGYWTSDANADSPIRTCYGYRLPHRGSTIDQANNDGFSRLDDGDPNTFWKSNPYLDKRYTGESNALHPQWIVIDLGRPAEVNAVRILWGNPYAVQYRVEYNSSCLPVDKESEGIWITFPGSKIERGCGSAAKLRLASRAVRARYVRILMTVSSETASPEARDERDRLGFAIREVYVGRIDEESRFHDAIRRAPDAKRQSVTYASSTDPWHRASDRDDHTEQPGFDRVFASGLTNGLPVLMPVGVLFDTPDNAAAELRYLESKGFPVTQVEMGEEPDGQCVEPEDYGALYLQFARSLHDVDRRLQLGGPCFQTAELDFVRWPSSKPGGRSWMQRFLDYLSRHGASNELSFFSFEWYPFDNVRTSTPAQLLSAPKMLTDMIRRLRADGVSPKIPWLITEYGYSAFAGRPEVDMAGALLNAGVVCQFLTLGGSAAYLYGYEPGELIDELNCNSWGNNMLFLGDENGRVRERLATYWGAWLLTHEWAKPGDEIHELYIVKSDAGDSQGREIVTAYAVLRPDGRFALLIVNKDPKGARQIRIRIRKESGKFLTPTGQADLFQFSSEQYRWRSDRESGHPIRSLPPRHSSLILGHTTAINLPAYSISVLRWPGNLNDVHLPLSK